MPSLPNKYRITNDQDYDSLLAKVGFLMKKGEQNVTADESVEILALAFALQEYEQKLFPILPPTSTEGIAELLTYENRLHENF